MKRKKELGQKFLLLCFVSALTGCPEPSTLPTPPPMDATAETDLEGGSPSDAMANDEASTDAVNERVPRDSSMDAEAGPDDLCSNLPAQPFIGVNGARPPGPTWDVFTNGFDEVAIPYLRDDPSGNVRLFARILRSGTWSSIDFGSYFSISGRVILAYPRPDAVNYAGWKGWAVMFSSQATDGAPLQLSVSRELSRTQGEAPLNLPADIDPSRPFAFSASGSTFDSRAVFGYLGTSPAGHLVSSRGQIRENLLFTDVSAMGTPVQTLMGGFTNTACVSTVSGPSFQTFSLFFDPLSNLSAAIQACPGRPFTPVAFAPAGTPGRVLGSSLSVGAISGRGYASNGSSFRSLLVWSEQFAGGGIQVKVSTLRAQSTTPTLSAPLALLNLSTSDLDLNSVPLTRYLEPQNGSTPVIYAYQPSTGRLWSSLIVVDPSYAGNDLFAPMQTVPWAFGSDGERNLFGAPNFFWTPGCTRPAYIYLGAPDPGNGTGFRIGRISR